MKKHIKNPLYFILIILLMWVAVTTIIQAFECPEMTQTELFLHIFNSFICDWKFCN